MMMDKVDIKGKVTVRLIDKNTGKVDYEKTLENVIIQNGAYCVMYGLTGIQSPSAITRAILFDSSKNPVTPVNGTWGTIQDSGSALSCKITCTDSSSASYTFRYLTLDTSYPQQPVYSAGYFANDRGSDITKASNQILTIEWTISAGYNTPP
jgi:hypothetical protein